MTNKEYSDVLMPNVEHDAQYYENLYKERYLSEDAIVSRFGPSPTGHMHIGNFYSAFVANTFPAQTGGVSFLRLEDTDQKREMENSLGNIQEQLKELNLIFDESNENGGNYGPYQQSLRKDIYHAFAKKMIEEDLAYPCFCTQDDINHIREDQESKKARLGYYGKYAKCRYISKEDAIKNIEDGKSFIIRLKSPGSFYNKVVLNDCIRGKIEMPENDVDEVLIKSDGLPTYHFAHVVDDHLMGTTHVVRGDEWVSSYPKHDQMFKMLGFKLPNFAHISPINIKDGESTRKLSKRKDAWAAISYYNEKGIPNEVIKLYLSTLFNSNFEEWYNSVSDLTYHNFKFSFDKMPISGPLFDIEKLNNISKTYFSRLTAEEIYENLLVYTKKYDEQFNNIISNNKDYVINMLNIERDVPKPRKDISAYSDIKNIYWFMFDEYFSENTDEYEEVTNVTKENLENYFTKVYSADDSQENWFTNLAEYADSIGFTKDRKAYKADPESFKGTTADFCKIIRIIITKKNLSPNLYDIIKLLGKENLLKRINQYFD